MKSTNQSPFDWQNKPSTLFTRKEKGYMKQHAHVKDLAPKQMNTYQKAKLAKVL
jgi:hypothetical protein